MSPARLLSSQPARAGRAKILLLQALALACLAAQDARAGEGTTELQPAKIYCGRVERLATVQEIRSSAMVAMARDKADYLEDKPSLAQDYAQGIASVAEANRKGEGSFAFVRIFRSSVGDPALGRFFVFVPEELRPLKAGDMVSIQRPTSSPQLMTYVRERLRLKDADGESLWGSFLWTSRISDSNCAEVTAKPEETRLHNKKLISSPDHRDQKVFAGLFRRYQQVAQALKNLDARVATDWPIFCTAHYANRRYDRLDECLEIYGELVGKGKPNDTNRLFISLLRANVALDMGYYHRAIELATILRQARYMPTETLRVLTVAHAFAGDMEKAREFLKELEAMPAESNYARGYKTAQLGQGYLATGEYGKAMEVLNSDWYKARTNVWGTGMLLGLVALKVVDEFKFPIPNSVQELALQAADSLLVGVGLAERPAAEVAYERAFVVFHALVELGRFEEARRHYDSAKHVWAGGAGSGQLQWSLQYDLGRLLEAEDKPEAAVSAYRQAIDLIEASRRSINMEASRIGFVGDKQAVYARLIDRLMADRKWDEAFLYVERAKSRALVDLLAEKQDFGGRTGGGTAGTDSAVPPSGPQALRSLGSGAAPAARGGNPAQMGIEADQLAALTGAADISLDRIRAAIPADETLVNYYFSGSRLHALVADRRGVKGYTLDGEGLEKEVRDFRAALQAGDDAAYAAGRKLYGRLILPLSGNMGSKSLTITPHGILHYLPFAALGDGGNYLLDSYALRMMPSAAALVYLKGDGPAKPHKLLTLGNPDLGNADFDLPQAQAEALQVASLFPESITLLRQDATRAAVRELGSQFSIIHIASHGEFRSDAPLKSGLLLARGQEAEGRLTVDDLYSMRLDNELVTLSACETGLGKVANGDDLVGLNRGFLYAGTRSIVSSLWQVDDAATAELMINFYRNLGQYGKREALRLAQIQTRRKYSHPFYWAAFQIVGNG